MCVCVNESVVQPEGVFEPQKHTHTLNQKAVAEKEANRREEQG